MGKTKIEWTEHSWNPISGCSHAGSPGCDMCYARRMARRLAGRYGYPEYPHHFDVTLHPDKLDVPLRRKKPTMYLVCSMSDPFHEDVPFEFVHQVFDVMQQARQHTFQVLTKRLKRMLDFLGIYRQWPGRDLPYGNVWLGASVENQAAADERCEYLRRCPAAVKFVSYEPALGPVDWMGWEFVDQIISGGESGPGARLSHPDWHRATRDFCQANGIAYFFKQRGAWTWDWPGVNGWTQMDVMDAKGNRRLPIESDEVHFFRVGKKRAGHLLDGQEWREWPR